MIVASDAAVDDCRPLASLHHARIVTMPGPSGPAAARNAAAAAAAGDVLVFIDSDVAVERDAFTRIRAAF